MASSPFDYLAELNHAVLARFPQLPSDEEIKHNWSGIGFSLLGHRMVAPLGEIVEMTPPQVQHAYLVYNLGLSAWPMYAAAYCHYLILKFF